MKYQANPVIVDAYKIVSVSDSLNEDVTTDERSSFNVATDDGENRHANFDMCARYIPQVGDYWVVQSDGYEYLNPKDVFERKYSPALQQAK
jgi:hypothetical protein